VRCAGCGEVFPADALLGDLVACLACGYEGRPAGVMRLSGPPSLEGFARNWQKAALHALEVAGEDDGEG
jgi:hypothetical protein